MQKIEALLKKLLDERFEYGSKKRCSCFYNCGSSLQSRFSYTGRADGIAGRYNFIDFE
ncbi:hypothetical protein ACCUM_4166 [Candidatus Accumulibacter phosphatis]|uniref:Uncharacterized protein n=1 Tax=Candidatus Accumulibacter phosphatis TaxID=327160 RepID=A0A5S4EH44_9PROT|nr:hypothetical protein ACCUM_4166 [Candidatus Accumulibacter phosphatis]